MSIRSRRLVSRASLLLLLTTSVTAQGLTRSAQGSRTSAGEPRALAGRVLVVDSEGGGNHRTIQEGIDAAGAGDVVLVESGMYSGFTISGKGVHLLAEQGAALRFRPPLCVSIRDLAAEQTVVLRGLQPAGGGPPLYLEASENAGTVWTEDCTWAAPFADLEAAASFRSCQNAFVVRCTITGGEGQAIDAHGLLASESGVYTYESSVTTGVSRSYRDGAAAVFVQQGFFFASGCFLRGGKASSCEQPAFQPGAAGPGLHLVASVAETLDCVVEPGPQVFELTCFGAPGVPVLLQTGSTHTLVAGSAHRFEVPSPLREGAIVAPRFEGKPGELVALHASSEASPPIPYPPLVGYLLDPDPEEVLAFGPLSPLGVLAPLVSIGELPPWAEASVAFDQGIFLGTQSGAASFAGSPSAAVVVDAALRPVFDDCDGSGQEDAYETVFGIAPDCNGNGVPDLCDVSNGTSVDCDGNGTPDECQLALLEAALRPSDPALADRYGAALASDGVLLAVGSSPGVYVFERGPDGLWPATETARLVPSDAPSDATAIAVSASRVLVGTPADDVLGSFSGAAVVFERGPAGWPATESAKLLPDDGAEYDGFGNAVALEGDLAVIGAPFDDQGGVQNAGAVYVFERHPLGYWNQGQKLVSGSAPGGRFGTSVSLRNARIAVAALQTVHVFERDVAGRWIEEASLFASSTSFWLGPIVQDGDTIAVGARHDWYQAWNSGTVFVFERGPSGWSESARLKAPRFGAFQEFGAGLALRGDRLIAGTGEFYYGGSTVRFFERSGSAWRDTGGLGIPASALAIGQETLFVGFENNNTEFPALALRLFDCNDNGRLDSCDIAAGESADEDGDGIPDECQR